MYHGRRGADNSRAQSRDRGSPRVESRGFEVAEKLWNNEFASMEERGELFVADVSSGEILQIVGRS